MKHIYNITDETKIRLDKFLSEQLSDISREHIKKLIKAGQVTFNHKLCTDVRKMLAAGDEVEFTMPELKPSMEPLYDVDLDIVYEDDDLLVINKQAGLTVHPGAGNINNTLVNVLYARYGKNLSDIAGEDRIGIVHRLDKDTTGLMLIAKNNRAHHSLSKQLEIRSLKRTYLALTYGMLVPPIGTISTHVAKDGERRRMVIKKSLGRHAVTHYKTLSTFFDKFSLVELELETGRTHQIRVHLEHKKTPIIGDPIYGKSLNHNLSSVPIEVTEAIVNFPRQALHARKISFIHPTTKEVLTFEAPLPKDMDEILKILK